MKRFTFLAFLAIFLITALASPALAADITGERTLNTTSLEAGESFRVTLNITVSGGTLYAPGIDENLPEGWTVTEVQNDGMIYQAANTQWALIGDMKNGAKTVVYDVSVPKTAETGTYPITGEVSGTEWANGEDIKKISNITGNTNVTVGMPGIHIYPGDDFASILTNAPSGSTIYWHAGDYGSDNLKTSVYINASSHIIGDSQDSVVLHNVAITVRNFADNSIIERLQFTGSKGVNINSRTSNSEFLTVRDCLFNNASGALMVRDSTIIENCIVKNSKFNINIVTGKGGGLVKNNTIDNDTSNYIMKIDNVNNVTCVENNFRNCEVTLSIFNFVGTNNRIAIYQNNFINCSSYAYYPGNDAGVSWSSPSEISYTYAGNEHIGTLGNYYDKYEGTDADGDGVGDTPYTVGLGTDYAPLMVPIENYGNNIGITPQIPVVDFTANITSGSAPISVNFTDQSTGIPTTWAWDFNNDGTVDSTEPNPIYTYAAAGNYTVNLTVTNEAGSNSTVKTDYITVSDSPQPTEPAPVAAFTADVMSGTAPLTVNFTDQSTGTPTSWTWDFGDSTNATEQNVSHTYTSTGNYIVNLTVGNANGINSTFATITVLKQPVFPVANFSTNVSEGYAPLSVQFTDLSENATEWSWDFGDGASATKQNVSHIYALAGNYTINLTVANVNGTDSKLATIAVSEKPIAIPVANFTSNVSEGYAPLPVQFTDLSENANEWNWNFGDGTSSTEQNPVHTYSKKGKYTVKLTVENAAGSNTTTKSKYINVVILKAPAAAFSASPTKGKAPLTVTFTDKSAGLPTSWEWSFGDGTSSTEQNRVHIYSEAGKYTVKLTVMNAAGSSTTSKSSYINVVNDLKAPTAAFSASPTSGYAPLQVTFTDKSKGSPTSWKWSFGDGTSSTEQNPVHIYSKTGKYTVKLTVKNSAGSSTTSKSSYINVSNPLKAPTAAFSASPTSGKAPLTVTFTDKSKDSPTSWKWNFGDGNTSKEQNSVHTYSKAGKYTVKLTVKNAAGSSTASKSSYINVANPLSPPTAAFSASPISGKAPLTVTFTDKSTGSPASWKWSFGDGTSSTEKNPVHTYSSAGKYTVKLTVKNSAGSSTKTMSRYIVVSKGK